MEVPGAEVEHLRRQHQGAEGAEGVRCQEGCPFPTREGSRERAVPPHQKFFNF